MEGDLVVVRAKTGALVRRVVEAQGDLVFISSPDEYDKRVKGLSALDPVGFLRGDVFAYDELAQAMLARGDFVWTDARPY